MSASAGPPDTPSGLSSEQLRSLDGVDRVPLLSSALEVIVGPRTHPDEPAFVIIEWVPGRVEHPIPGSSLWRAAIELELAKLSESNDPNGPVGRTLSEQLRQTLRRWPDLETWWLWLRTGWLAPPRRAP